MSEEQSALDDKLTSDLPPSAHYAYLLLQVECEVTHEELVEKATLPERTLQRALRQLRDAGLVEKRPYPGDARRSLYDLTE
jgi:DNA-binding HxlR family transcriptional regulator